MNHPFNEWILSARDAFGEAPRTFSRAEMRYLKGKKPTWLALRPFDGMQRIFRRRKAIVKRGRVVWGSIIQANSLLYDRGDLDCPAVALYSLDPRVDQIPTLLRKAASKLFDVKGKIGLSTEVQRFADLLADEHETQMNLHVPSELCEGIQCTYTTIMVFRKHLPDGFLENTLFPMIVCPEETDATMILPSGYWPGSFVDDYWSI